MYFLQRLTKGSKKRFSFSKVFLLLLGVVMANPLMAEKPFPLNSEQIPPSQQEINGQVLDATQIPIPGVSVREKSRPQNGATTNENGEFRLQASPGAILVFTYVGYAEQEVTVPEDGSPLTVILQDAPNQLDEVVLVGYQSLRRSDLTGSISSVKAEEINVNAPNLGQGLVGKVAGVEISQVSGAPYVTPKVRVRGVGSINAGTDPLYVIDGYPAGNDLFINPNDIESINVLKDAASAAIYGSRAAGGVILITTKKGREASMRMVYDYQAGIDQLAKKVDLLNASQFAQLHIDGHNEAYKDLVLNTGGTWNDAMFSDDNATRVGRVGNASSVSIPEELYDFANQRMITPQYDTDWQDELYRNAVFQRHNLSFTGGNDKARYFISGSYQDQPGIITSTGQKRINFRSNVDAQINDRIKVGANVFITNIDNQEVEEGRFNQGPIMGALVYAPIFPAYLPDGGLAKNEMAALSNNFAFQQIENPVALAREMNITRKGTRGTYNAYGIYNFMPELSFKANLGLQTNNEKYEYYRPTSLSNGIYPPYSPQAINNALATARQTNYLDKLAEFTLNYQKNWKQHNLTALAGYSVQQTTNDMLSVSARGFEHDRIQEITGGGTDPNDFFLNRNTAGMGGLNNTGKAEWTLISYFARAIYSYGDRYFLTASFRTDGSSRFGPLNRWGTFPSVSGGWTISNEDFYDDWLGAGSTVKFRASWGLSGNNNIGNYNYQQTLGNPVGVVFGNNGTVVTGTLPGAVRDPALGWETTSQVNIGLDLALLNGRLSVIGNYYNSRSYDLLFNQPIPSLSGSESWLTNLRNAAVRNRGFDLQVDGRVIQQQDFNLNLSGNFSLNRNKVLDMGGANTILSMGAERQYITHITEQGSPIGMFYGFQVAGMVRESDMVDGVAQGIAPSAASSNPLKPGDLYFVDINGDGIVNDEDKTIIGNPHPDFFYGFSLSGNYKRLDFSAAFNGVYGADVLDGQSYYIYNMEGSGNQYTITENRYRSEAQPGDGIHYRASRAGTQSNSTRLSSFYLRDGSFLRCTNISVGYTIPNLSAVTNNTIQNIRVYASVNNPFTITDYMGYNPEVDYNNGANLTPGVDYGKYPLVRSFNLGARLTF
ncbi:TonB-dependent receptor [Olivibacter sp. SDN3]|uniref:SusC/RagA family TonB-linked outer membrane protein n=1 Tax=Olivibacter sp. SDN3 TaxID=2764720 RepID=UPI001651A87D|nr:TonB-dependent receptor [Olivibacter sp. SDN3]QNL51451.1 TonB-dependent receptor [Olivibacter sp. SDN3]